MFVVKHTMAKAFEVGIGTLCLEFLAHTLVFFLYFTSAGTIATTLLQALLDYLYNFFVGIECNFHKLDLKNVA